MNEIIKDKQYFIIILYILVPIPIIYLNLFYVIDQDITQHLLIIKKSLNNEILYKDFTNNYGPFLPYIYKFLSLKFFNLGINYFFISTIFYIYSFFVLKKFFEIYFDEKNSIFFSSITSLINILFIGGIYHDNLSFILIFHSIIFLNKYLEFNKYKYIYICNIFLILSIMTKTSYGFISFVCINFVILLTGNFKHILHIFISSLLLFVLIIFLFTFSGFENFYIYTIKIPYSFVTNLFNHNISNNLYPEKNIFQLFYIIIFPLKINAIHTFIDIFQNNNGYTRLLFLPIVFSYYFFYIYFFFNIKNFLFINKFKIILLIFFISLFNVILFGKNFHLLSLFNIIFFTIFLSTFKKKLIGHYFLITYIFFLVIIIPSFSYIKNLDFKYFSNELITPLKITDNSYKFYDSNEISKYIEYIDRLDNDCLIYIDDEINFLTYTSKKNSNFFTDYNFYQSINVNIDKFKNTSLQKIINKNGCLIAISLDKYRFFRSNPDNFNHRDVIINNFKLYYKNSINLDNKILLFTN